MSESRSWALGRLFPITRFTVGRHFRT